RKQFPEVEIQPSIVDDIVANYEEYKVLPGEIREAISLTNFINLKKNRSGPRAEPRPQTNQRDLQQALGKLSLPTFDGSGKSTTRAWIQKLDTFLSLRPMMEEEAIKFATLHLK
ncbi:hypothetical protein KI387_017090, partial [Taxus chinensis]